jgi:ParB-like chromosome segregation protein Spo0J
MNVTREWMVELVPIDSVQPHPENFREHDVGAISVLISRMGLYQPIVVQRSTGFIAVGNGRWKALKALGHVEIPVRYEDWTDDEARAVLVGDNWIHGRGRNQDPELFELMQALQAEEELFAAAGLEDDDVEKLEQELAEADKPLKLDSRKMVRKPKPVECPKCGARFVPGQKEKE